MANCKKFTRAAVGHLFAHYERQRDEKGEYVKFGNQKIDPSRTHLNYNLAAEDQPMGQHEYLQKRLGEVFCQNRKDVNVMCSWVVTAPEDLPREELESFFRHSYDFLSDRYGKDNVISAYVHMDESSPHMHFSFIPVCPDKKRGLKVSAKKVISKTELERFHPLLQKYLEDKLGHEVSVLNGATIDGNKTIKQLKKISELDEKIENRKEILSRQKSEYENLQKEKKAAAADLAEVKKDIEKEKRILSSAQNTQKKGISWHENLTGTKLPGNKIVISQDDFKELKDNYEYGLYAKTNLQIEKNLHAETREKLDKAKKWEQYYYSFRAEHKDDIELREKLEKQVGVRDKKIKELEDKIAKIMEFIESHQLLSTLMEFLHPKKDRTRDQER